MNDVLELLGGLPSWVYVAAGGAVVVVAAVIIMVIIKRRDFIRRIRLAAEDPEEAELQVRQKYTDTQLLRRSRLIESVARRYSTNVLPATGIDELWRRRLRRSKRERDFRRVLEFSREKGLFSCFLAALEKPKLRPVLFRRLDDTGDLLGLRNIALAGEAENFDGHTAFEMFSERIDEIREMTGDQDWVVRFFAIKVLLYDHDPRSERAIWECMDDAGALVRTAIAAEFQPSDREGFSEHLQHLVLDDPSFEVRRAARRRIAADFAERYRLESSELTPEQVVHALEQLDEDSIEDENLALTFLGHDDREFRLPAAQFLDRRGALSQMLRSAELGDRQSFDRTAGLLENALDVHVTGFLEEAQNAESVAVILLSARLLARKGPVSLIRPVAKGAFSNLDTIPEVRDELFETALSMLANRGDDAALELLREELRRRRHNGSEAAQILNVVPQRAHLQFSDAFLECLTDPEFSAFDTLVKTVARMPYPDLMPALVEIVKAGQKEYSHQIRIRALRTIGAYQDPAVLQFVLENLSVLPHEEAREFTSVLAGFAADEFDARVEKLLQSTDASVRAALISALPAAKKKDFFKHVRDASDDADPEVRIAAVWALAEFDDKRALAQASDKLRDPVTRVRTEAARALGAHGGDKMVKGLQEVLTDENEVEAVKTAAIRGLGASTSKSSIDVLVNLLEQGAELEQETVHALAGKRGKRDIGAIVEHMKDADPGLRERLTGVFRIMATDGEEALVELLQEDIPSLRPFITEVLEKVGYVESLIRRLTHRDPSVRRRAAEILSSIGTVSAFRGIVRAARDPDQEVRVRVTRALDTLASDSGQEMLSELQNDPDKRVRKYTMWALQRAKARSL